MLLRGTVCCASQRYLLAHSRGPPGAGRRTGHARLLAYRSHNGPPTVNGNSASQTALGIAAMIGRCWFAGARPHVSHASGVCHGLAAGEEVCVDGGLSHTQRQKLRRRRVCRASSLYQQSSHSVCNFLLHFAQLRRHCSHLYLHHEADQLAARCCRCWLRVWAGLHVGWHCGRPLHHHGKLPSWQHQLPGR